MTIPKRRALLKNQSASSTSPGVVTLATNAETLTGTISDKVVVPTALKYTLEQTYGDIIRKYAVAEVISSGTSGAVSAPSNATIILNQWANGVDAITSKSDSEGYPTGETAETSGGDIVTATLDVAGDWTISAAPSSYPIALIYIVEQPNVNFDPDDCLVMLDLTDPDFLYALLQGRSGGQTLIGGTGTGDDLTLQTTSDGSKGSYILTELNTANGIVQTDGSGVLSTTTTPIKTKSIS